MIVSIGSIKFRLLLALVFAIFSVASSHIAQFDQYWEKRATEAKEAALQAYHPDPETVVNDFNNHTLSYFRFGEDGNNTRRLLHKYRGKCMAVNPIDRCWRCRKNWANRRKKLADCVIGFGRHTTGGKKGRYYVVTDPSDNDLVNPKPGTLRHAVIQPQPLWIVFKRSMIIRLTQELIMTSDKTIDGRGANVHINGGAGFMLQFVRNIIIHGIRIHQTKQGSGGMIRDSVSHYGHRSASDGDAISIFGSSNIWLDHLSMSNGVDGLVDAVEGSTAITISNCRMTHHDHVMLFGASDKQSADAKMQITVAFNHFGKGLVQRMPRVRWGFVHVVNNHYTHWKKYAIGGSQHPTIISQGNRFIAPPNPNAKEVTKREYSPRNIWKNWLWRSQSDVMMDGAFFTESGNKFQKYPKEGLVPSMHGSFASKLTMFSGALNCFKGRRC